MKISIINGPIEKIIDRDNNIIFQHPHAQPELDDTKSLDGFPWFTEELIDEIQPFDLLPKLNKMRHILILQLVWEMQLRR